MVVYFWQIRTNRNPNKLQAQLDRIWGFSLYSNNVCIDILSLFVFHSAKKIHLAKVRNCFDNNFTLSGRKLLNCVYFQVLKLKNPQESKIIYVQKLARYYLFRRMLNNGRDEVGESWENPWKFVKMNFEQKSSLIGSFQLELSTNNLPRNVYFKRIS